MIAQKMEASPHAIIAAAFPKKIIISAKPKPINTDQYINSMFYHSSVLTNLLKVSANTAIIADI